MREPYYHHSIGSRVLAIQAAEACASFVLVLLSCTNLVLESDGNGLTHLQALHP